MLRIKTIERQNSNINNLYVNLVNIYVSEFWCYMKAGRQEAPYYPVFFNCHDLSFDKCN